MTAERRGNIEVRTHDSGEVAGKLDEVIVYVPGTDKVILHLEQMDDDCFWMRVEGDDGNDFVVFFGAVLGDKWRWNLDHPATLEKDPKQGPIIQTTFEWDEDMQEKS